MKEENKKVKKKKEAIMKGHWMELKMLKSIKRKRHCTELKTLGGGGGVLKRQVTAYSWRRWKVFLSISVNFSYWNVSLHVMKKDNSNICITIIIYKCRPTTRHCRTTIGHNVQLLWEQTDWLHRRTVSYVWFKLSLFRFLPDTAHTVPMVTSKSVCRMTVYSVWW